MTMENKRPVFKAKTGRSARCDVSGREYDDYVVRDCRHPSVAEAYGYNGTARVSFYVCQKCRYRKEIPFTSAIGCMLDEEENNERSGDGNGGQDPHHG